MIVADDTRVHDALGQATQRKASLAQTAGAVFWSFFGVRRHADYEADMAKLNPLHLVMVAVLCALMFILALWLLVGWVVSSGVAA